MTDAPTEREDEGAWAKLRRRKVVQWGIAYAAGAWALLQVVGFAADTFEWPRLIQQFASIGVAVGLPIVIVVAWYHGDRGQQRVSGAELAILSVLLALGAGALWLYGQRNGQVQVASAPSAASTAAQAPSAASADERPSIAVLPFENRSGLDNDIFFVDGIHDDILTQLSKVSALKVISRTSVEQFRDTKLPTKAIAEQLGVKSILEGAVQRAGDRVRINVQLIDATNDEHLWAESYDRELTAANIFAIQSEVAAAIAGTLKATLTAGEKARINALPTQNLEAWENYQLGRQRFAKRTSASLTEAEQYFKKAVELDPGFALAYAGLAKAVATQVEYAGAPVGATLDRAQTAADNALRLAPELADAWGSVGTVEFYRGQNIDRLAEVLLRAIELDPNHVEARKTYALVLRDRCRFEESVAQLEHAARLDPLSAIVQLNLGAALEGQGRFRDAASRYRKAIEIDSLMPSPYKALANLAAHAGNDYAAAVPLMERAMALDPGNASIASQLAALYWDLGDDAASDLVLRQAEQRWPDSSAVQFSLALRDLQRRDLDGAAQRARRLLDANPRNRGGLVFLGIVDYRQGRYAIAAERYRKAYPELFATSAPRIDESDYWNYWMTYSVAQILQDLGERDRANVLLEGLEAVLRKMPQLGLFGYAPTDAAVLALRGRKREALTALRSDQQAGWRERWRYYRDVAPAFDSIRDDPEFKAIFADIERDMARQRAELAKRPKDAPLDLGAAH